MQKKLLFAIFLFLCGILLPESHTFANGNASALVISRGDYGSKASNLSPGPENDGKNFQRILRQAYGESLSVIALEKEGAQSVADVTNAIQSAFGKSDAGDKNYFFYSGHGSEQGMWLGGREFLSASDLAQAFSGIQGTNFLVIDCCYSGNLISLRNTESESFAKQFLDEFQDCLKKNQARSAITNDSFHVLVASSEGEESVQGSLGAYGEQLGYFTSAVAVGCGIDFTRIGDERDYLCAAMADLDRDGSLTFDELYQYVAGILYTSDAQVYPEHDKTQFLNISASQIPQTVVKGVHIDYDEESNLFLEVEYQSGEGGIFQGGLYRIRSAEEVWNSLAMSVRSEPSAYAALDQTGSWEFQANTVSSKAALPLGAGSLEAGEYLFLVNEKGGNTGCYLFRLYLEENAESDLMQNLSIQAPELFSIEEEGTLEILADFGKSRYSNQYDAEVSCSIRSRSGLLVSSLGRKEIRTEWSEEAYARSCKFQWNGMKMDGQQVPAGIYIIEIVVNDGNGTERRQKAIKVESEAVESDSRTQGKVSIEGMEIQLSCVQYVYDGIAKCPTVTIPGLLKGKDFSVTYEKHCDAGEAIVRIVGIGNYSGTVVRKFTILPMYITGLEVKVQKKLYYTGSPGKVKVRVFLNDYTAKVNRDYTLTYSNNKKPGYGKVTIQGIGNYTGKITKKFKIFPQKPRALKKAKTRAGAWKIRWKKSAAVDGYELQYCTGKKFKKNVQRRLIKGKNKKNAYITIADRGANYYFRIRSYKKVNGKRWYSPFIYSN